MKEKVQPLRTKDLTLFKPGMFIATNGTGTVMWYLVDIKSSTMATVVVFNSTRMEVKLVTDKDFSKSEAQYFIERSKKHFFDRLVRHGEYWSKR